jgi:hypothetical protein
VSDEAAKAFGSSSIALTAGEFAWSHSESALRRTSAGNPTRARWSGSSSDAGDSFNQIGRMHLRPPGSPPRRCGTLRVQARPTFGPWVPHLLEVSRAREVAAQCKVPRLTGDGGDAQGQSSVQSLTVVSLEYAADHLLAAVQSVAVSDGPLQTRLQTAWEESVHHVWERPCLTTELLARFKALWDRVTDATAGPRSTTLRQLTTSEAVAAVDELIALAVQTAIAASQSQDDVRLATLSDLT